MLRRDNGFDHRGKVVDIWQCLDAKHDVIEGCTGVTGGFFGRSND